MTLLLTSTFSTILLVLLARPVSGFLPTGTLRKPSFVRSHPLLHQAASSSDDDNGNNCFTVGVLGDLHMDPRDMKDYAVGREHFYNIFRNQKNCALVSLGDLGESKAVNPKSRRNSFRAPQRVTNWPPATSSPLACRTNSSVAIVVTSKRFSFLPPRRFTILHLFIFFRTTDLEGIDEFPTDEENLQMMLEVHDKPTPQFLRKIADKTLLVGLTSTVFRDAKYTSHEVTIDQQQLNGSKKFSETILPGMAGRSLSLPTLLRSAVVSKSCPKTTSSMAAAGSITATKTSRRFHRTGARTPLHQGLVFGSLSSRTKLP